MKQLKRLVLLMALFLAAGSGQAQVSLSGIYPHLAFYNNEGECGTGAVVPWAGKLWVITYGPHLPFGSSDKLYCIDENLVETIFPGSIGGTPANRMIHPESNQLFIGPYAIDAKGEVRVIPYSVMPGRHTGNARHLTDPAGKIYYATMEEGFYEVDVNTLAVTELYRDGNLLRQTRGANTNPNVNPQNATLPGAHGKGLYSGQGVMVFSNNGEASELALEKFDIESGVLGEWDGKAWKTVRRNQFVEVTGPGGILGNSNPETDPIWATGWDHKSVLLAVRDPKTGWSFFRLPKASNSYDGAHGWNTEWPRIRNVGTADAPDYLMTMHGMFWHFPAGFTASQTAGIRPRSAYLKVIGDFTRWKDQLVFGCDDSAEKEFLNKRAVKGSLEGPGQSNSNLWFTSFDLPDHLGPKTATGSVWIDEAIKANSFSEPFLFAGWAKRSAWVTNHGVQAATFRFEIDEKGNNIWKKFTAVKVEAGASVQVPFAAKQRGEWIRVAADCDTRATVVFTYADVDRRLQSADPMFRGLATLDSSNETGGLIWGLGKNRRKMAVLAGKISNGQFNETGYYELDSTLNLVRQDDAETAAFVREHFAVEPGLVTIDQASVLVVDDKGRRWRLPKGDERYASLNQQGIARVCREVATERDLFNCSGTFYELPAENADGFAKVRPVASHTFRVHDFSSFRGLLVMTGVDPEQGKGNEHVIVSNDGLAAVWAGGIDDLWKVGKPVGQGGPLKNSAVKTGVPSDPYLIGYYDKKDLTIEHNAAKTVRFTIELDPSGNGTWMAWKTVSVKAGEKFSFRFPDNFEARWIRFTADSDCSATTWLTYR